MSHWRLRTAPDSAHEEKGTESGQALPSRPPAHWADELSISPLLLEILWRRGFTDRDAIDAFLSARLDALTPPERWPQLPRAAALLAEELLAGKRLAVWGDYDVDGVTATALVLDVLAAHGLEAAHHLPDRQTEGYGLNVPGVEALARAGCDILLTVDCGIADTEALQRARALGMTVIVTDTTCPRNACRRRTPSAIRARVTRLSGPADTLRALVSPFTSWPPSMPRWPPQRESGSAWATCWTSWPWARLRMSCA